ncbi:hypothetical protein HAV15_001432 [Penicillium sp. str. |nr:hypothetical protein HAV15_001432 [Penicillium sp. str. \
MSTDISTSENASKCPVSGSGKAATKPYLTDHVKDVFSTHEKKHHNPFYHVSHHHEDKVHDVHAELKTAGSKVEDGIHKAKKLLEEDKKLNPEMVREALAIYLTHSKDAQQRRIPAPSLKDHAVFRKQRPELHPADSSNPPRAVVAGEVVTPDTLQGAALLSYWRDDYDLNDSHYHWHMVYRGAGGNNKENIRTIDRQGEIFLYTHSQMVARYEVEGLCWNLPLVRAWSMYDDYLEYGYQPLPALQEFYGGYPPYTRWYRVHSPDMATVEGVTVGVSAMETWRDNIYAAINQRTVKTAKFLKDENGDYVYEKGQKVRIGQPGKLCLTGDNVMNYIGGLLDAQYKFFDPLPDGYEVDDEVYGLTLHNYGLGKMAEISYHKGDPENGDYGTPYGLMISNFGAIRDPCFFPWYKHMQEFRRLVANNYVQDIKEHGAAVRLTGLIIRPQDKKHSLRERGGVTSYMGAPAVDLLESKAKLDHEPYEWSVKVQRLASSSHGKRKQKRAPDTQVVTLRFFIAPKELVDDYHHWIEMDKVTVTLPPGSNSIQVTRLDSASSVSRKMNNYSEVDADYGTRTWCRCGWPRNLMLPAGRPEGMPFVAFCMATDDAVDGKVWSESHSFCGATKKDDSNNDVPDAGTTYPDPRGMGYPFNRAWYDLERPDKDTSQLSVDKIIRNNRDYPYLAVRDFNIYRQTRYDHPATEDSGPNNITWFGTIKGYFKDQDKACMQSEYGYNLQQYEDVAYHHHNIYYATATGRMPLQMGQYTQNDPDPKHPLWTPKMCKKFKRWTLHGCPKGQEGVSDPDSSDSSDSEEDSELEETPASGN